MKKLNGNKAEYLTSQNQRLFKNQVSLQGYVDETTVKRLDRVIRLNLPEGLKTKKPLRPKRGQTAQIPLNKTQQLATGAERKQAIGALHKAEDLFLDRMESSRSVRFENKAISKSPTRYSPSKSPHSP